MAFHPAGRWRRWTDLVVAALPIASVAVPARHTGGAELGNGHDELDPQRDGPDAAVRRYRIRDILRSRPGDRRQDADARGPGRGGVFTRAGRLLDRAPPHGPGREGRWTQML